MLCSQELKSEEKDTGSGVWGGLCLGPTWAELSHGGVGARSLGCDLTAAVITWACLPSPLESSWFGKWSLPFFPAVQASVDAERGNLQSTRWQLSSTVGELGRSVNFLFGWRKRISLNEEPCEA